jgi:7,8-dihydropterin-6-yl-methyl-4-(beta-D-ribofuranosyl)aminobenzene 5'-phosphate synthase
MRATKETVMSRREVHLVVSNDADIEKIVTSLRDKFKVAYVAPGHCTGEPTFTALVGSRDLYAGLGTTFALGPSSSWQSISRPPMRSAARSRRRCSRGQIR